MYSFPQPQNRTDMSNFFALEGVHRTWFTKVKEFKECKIFLMSNLT